MKLIKLIIAFAFLPVCNANAQIITKLNLPKGTRYEVTSVTKGSSVASIMGQEMESGTDISITETIEVKDKRAGETDLVSTVTKLTANVQAMGQQTVYDSDKADNDAASTETFGKIKGSVKHITVDDYGKIIKQDKDEETAAAGAMMGVPNDALAFLKNGFVGREMKPGTTWYDSTATAAEKITISTAGNYTVETINAATGTITIAFKGTETTSGRMEQMGQEMIMTSSGKVNSQTEVDMATGLIKKSTKTTDGNMNIEAGGMSIPVTTKTIVTVSAKQL